MTKLFRVAEAAAVLGLTPMTVYQMIKQGRLRAVHPTGGKTIRIRPEDLGKLVGAASDKQ